MLLDDAGAGLQSVCCLVVSEEVQLVCCKSDWLLCCRLVVPARGRNEETRDDPQKTY